MEEHPQARFIVETLTKAGFIAYYAGGWVRDFLLNHPSDDIDIATSAPPETVQALFEKTVPIGISFGIILVLIDHHQYEVATFRQDFDYKEGRRPSRIAFCDAKEDAKRRDFTINGMFYDPLKEQILDYVDGQTDLKLRIIRAIGNPHERINEDRLRMIRAIRLSCRFQFQIEPKTEAAIRSHAKELFPAVAIERIVQEFEKGRSFGKLRPMLIQLHNYGLLQTIFPALEHLPLSEIEKRLEPIRHYPQKAPLIGQLLPLFPNSTAETTTELCKYLKLSNLDQQFALFLFHARHLLHKTELPYSKWAYFYANPFAAIAIQIEAAHLDPTHRPIFLKIHEERMHFLNRSLQRIREHNPLIKSSDLLKEGIPADKTMGILLKEADRISIDEQIHDPEQLLKRLRSHPEWPNLS